MKDLPESLKFRDLYSFGDDLKTVAIAKTKEEIQTKWKSFSNWVDNNRKILKPDKSYKLEFRGTSTENVVGNISLEDLDDVEDLSVIVFTLRNSIVVPTSTKGWRINNLFSQAEHRPQL